MPSRRAQEREQELTADVKLDWIYGYRTSFCGGQRRRLPL
jgi:hypothetical protein